MMNNSQDARNRRNTGTIGSTSSAISNLATAASSSLEQQKNKKKGSDPSSSSSRNLNLSTLPDDEFVSQHPRAPADEDEEEAELSSASHSHNFLWQSEVNSNNGMIINGGSSSSRGQQQQLDPVTLIYYETHLQSFNLLEPVINPSSSSSNNQQNITSLWNTLWKSELLGGEGELEEYDPTSSAAHIHNPIFLELEKVVSDAFTTSSVGDYYTSLWNTSTNSSSTNHAMIPEIVPKLDLNDFHRFMGRTGPLSTTFMRRKEHLQNEQVVLKRQQMLEEQEDGGKTYKNKNKTQQFLLNKQNFPQLLACEEFIPNLFFSPDFDLTDPRNFEQLMSHLDEKFCFSSTTDDDAADQLMTATTTAKKNNKKDKKIKTKRTTSNEEDISTSVAAALAPTTTLRKTGTIHKKHSSSKSKEEWKLARQEMRQVKSDQQTQQLTLLTQYLDSVEISLLEQVRSKSHAYFTETSRFAELKNLVKSAVEQVSFLKSTLVELLICNVEDVERIPKDAFERNAYEKLSHLLDLVDNAVTAKACVAGLISTNDDDDARGAIEAICGARMLFDDARTEQQQNQQQQQLRSNKNRYILGKLKALSNVNNQLGEYEKIVVGNLSNKLVDIFLAWDNNNSNISDLFSSSSGQYYYNSSQFSDSSSWRSNSTSDNNSAEKMQQTIIARNLIHSLSLCNKLSETNVLYTDRVCDIIKTTVKTTVQECTADAMQQRQQQQVLGGGSIATSVTSMTFEQFMECLDLLFEQILGEIKSALSVSRFLRQDYYH